jgi:phosphate transport system substrate-binding protein
MKKIAISLGVLFLTLVMGGSLSVVRAADEISFAGCGIVKQAFMDELAKAFQEKHGTAVALEGGGATVGIRSVASGEKDLGGTCRHSVAVPEEQGVTLHHVAWDALVVIVNPKNPVGTITLDQLKAVIEGRITDWGALGGPAGKPLSFYARKGKTSGVGLMARETIFHDPDKEFKAAKFFDSTGPLERAIETDQWALGLTGISSAQKRKVKMLKLNGIDVTKENIARGKYLLYRPLYIVTKERPDPGVVKFIDFAKSDEGQEIISKQGTVNLREGALLWRLYRQQIKQ